MHTPQPSIAPAAQRRMSVLGIANLLDWQAQLGIAREALLAGTGIAPALLEDPNASITIHQDMAFTRQLLRLNPQPALGLLVGQQYRMSAFGHLGMMLPLAATAREAVVLFIRYINLSYTHFQTTLALHGDAGTLTFSGADYLGTLRRYYLERDMAFAVSMTRNLFADLMPSPITGVQLSEPPPEAQQVYRDFFGVPLRHGAATSCLLFNARSLDRPMPHANALALRLVEPECAQRQARLCSPSTWTQRVQAVLGRQGAHAYPAMAYMAAQFHCTERTLRRHLQQEGSSYQRLLDQARCAHASQLLQQSRLPIEKIAQQLGYSEAAAFSRAFTAWQGESPLRHRQGLQKPPV